MGPVDEASLVLVTGAGAGLLGASLFAVLRGGTEGGLRPRTAFARAGSYAALALILLVAVRSGVAGVAVLVASLGAIGLSEWSRMFDLPVHHRIGLLAADVAIVWAI